jgi:tetratricopeptide (TPR) repeat protein
LELLALAMQRDIEEIEAAVMDLQQRSLAELLPKVERIPAHYRLHDLTYTYARALFSREFDDLSPIIAAARQFIHNHLRDFDDLEFEQNNLLGAANAARRKDDPQSLIDIMRMLAVDGYLDARGHSLLFLQRLDDAIHAADTLKQDETRHYLLGKRGNVYALRGDLTNALQAYEAALKLAPNPNREALCLSTIGGIRFQQNSDDYDSYFEHAYQIAEKNEDDFALSHVLDNRGGCAKEKGDFDTAHRYYTQAAEVAERIAMPERLSRSLYNLGMVEVEMGRFDHALGNHQRAYSIAVEEDSHFMIATAYSGMACAYHGLGQRNKSQEFFDKALVLYRRQGAERYVTWVVSFMEKEGYAIKSESD